MKKFSKRFAIMMLVFMFSTTMVVSAQEASTSKTAPEDRFNGFITELEKKQETRFDEASANWSQNQADRQKRNTRFLEVVALYAPELSSSYVSAFAAHDALHIDLFNTRSTIKSDFNSETISGLTALKTTLFTQVEAGDITWKEAREGLKTYLTGRKDLFTTSKDAYQTAISAEVTDWETKAAEVKVLHQELKAALEAEDSAVIAVIIADLYDYLVEHMAFDQFKLDTMNSIF